MKTTVKIFLAGLLSANWGASQAIELNKDFSVALNAGVYSDYKSRGVSQTKGDPAVQGSVTLSHSSGAYIGAWSSNVDFGHGSPTRQEIDYYAGYFWQISEEISLDLAYYNYEYPKQSSLNYSETYARLTAYGAYVGGYYSDDLYGNQSYLYSFIGYGVTLPLEIGLDIRYGRVDFKDGIIADENNHTRDSYNEWQASLKKEFISLDWSLSYVDSNLSRSECESYSGYRDTCSPSVVVGVSKTF
ncbi:TorF family putative porin [Pseudomonas putida]|uniref:TorF family putative porin n=1 Tax=Pseudomonas putida TaxID=303 RepID=UPI00335DE62F